MVMMFLSVLFYAITKVHLIISLYGAIGKHECTPILLPCYELVLLLNFECCGKKTTSHVPRLAVCGLCLEVGSGYVLVIGVTKGRVLERIPDIIDKVIDTFTGKLPCSVEFVIPHCPWLLMDKSHLIRRMSSRWSYPRMDELILIFLICKETIAATFL